MNKDELQTLIREAERRMNDHSLSDSQRQASEERYWNLLAVVPSMLDENPAVVESPPPNTYPQHIQKHVNDIWSKLDPEGKRRRRA